MSDVKVYGAGLQFACVDHLAVFRIAAKGVERSDISAIITSPSDRKKRARLVEEDENGTYRAEWKPIETGEHSIDVRVHNQSVKNGPFECNVGDPELVTMRNLPKHLKPSDLANPVSFNIDASAAGSGNLEIMINEGRVHCDVRDLGQRSYLATFVPMQPTAYVIRMTFNGQPVKGSPWVLQVCSAPVLLQDQQSMSLSPVSLGSVILATPLNVEHLQSGALPHYACLTSPGGLPALLHSPASISSDHSKSYSKVNLNESTSNVWADVYGEGLQSACVNWPAVFDILAYSLTLRDIAVNVMGMNGREIPYRLTEKRAGHFQCEYVCTELGLVRVDVALNGRPVDKSPFMVSTYDPCKVMVERPRGGTVGKPVQFSIDASSAGKGQLEISINHGQVPNNVQLQSAGHCLVTFIPDRSGSYQIDVTLNGKPARDCPMSMEVWADSAAAAAIPPSSHQTMPSRPVARRSHASGDACYGADGQLNRSTSVTEASPRFEQYTSYWSRDNEPVYSNLNLSTQSYAGKKPSPVAYRREVDKARSDTYVDQWPKRSALNGHSQELASSMAKMAAFGDGADLDSVDSLPSAVRYDSREESAAAAGPLYAASSTEVYTTVRRYDKDDRQQAEAPRPVEQQNIFAGKLEEVNSWSENQLKTLEDLPSGSNVIVASGSTVKRLSKVTELAEVEQGAVSEAQPPEVKMRSLRLEKELVPLSMVLGPKGADSVRGGGVSWHKTKLVGPIGGSVRLGKTAEYRVQPRCANDKQDLSITVTRGNRDEMLPVAVEEQGEDYVLSFVPTTVGIHRVKFALLDQPHPMSPMVLKVYNPDGVVINDILCSAVGTPVQFTVDATRAGHGDLEIAIKDDKGSTIPSKVMSQESNANFKVSFTPVTAGKYGIHVSFNGDRVPGSPFVCDVPGEPNGMDTVSLSATSSGTAVTGSALSSGSACVLGDLPKLVAVHRTAQFQVVTSARDAEFGPTVIGPNSKRLEVKVGQVDANTYSVEFVPTEVGDHLVDLKVNKQSPVGLPFTCRVFDASRINVSKIGDGYPSKPVHFVVDASEAGVGSLEVAVNDGKVASMAQNLGHHRYDISFVPTESIVHEISIRFNGDHVPGSPFKCRVLPASTVAVVSAHGLDKVRVNSPVSFDVQVPDEDLLDVTIQDPTGSAIPYTKSKVDDEKVKVEFTLKTVGLHQVDVRVRDSNVLGSPFGCKAYNPGQVKLLPPTGNEVNQPVSFIVDAGKAGTGNMEIAVSVDGKNVPNQVQSEGNARFKVSFAPTEAKPHTVSVKFNQEPVPGSPMVINVTSGEAVRDYQVSGSGVSTAVAGETASFTIDVRNQKDEQCNVIVTAPDNMTLPVKCFKQKDGNFRVEYKPMIVGEHKVEVSLADREVNGSPFTCTVYDPQLVRLVELDQIIVGQETSIKINTAQGGTADLSAEVVDPDGRPVAVDILRDKNGGEDELRFRPTKTGRHELRIHYGDRMVSGGPVVFFTEESADAVRRTATDQCVVKDTARMLIDGAGLKDEPKVKVTDPDGHSVKSGIRKVHDGKWEVTFAAPRVGLYTVDATHHRKSLPDYPRQFRVIDPKRVYVIDGIGRKPMTVGQRGYVTVDTNTAGVGDLKAEVHGPSGRCNVGVERKNKGQYTISFVPLEEGEYAIHLFWSGIEVPGGPQVVCAKRESKADIHVHKVRTSGQGLKEACTKVEAEFFIDGSDAGAGYPTCQMSGRRERVPITLHPIEPGKWRATYTATISGSYAIDVFWANQPVRGSPFTVQVMPSGNAENVFVHTEPLQHCVAGKTTKLTVDTKKAGLGELKAAFKGPTKTAKAEIIESAMCQYTIFLKSNETGRHKLYIKFSGEDVPGSPFTVPVSSLPDAKKIHVYGSGVENGVLSTFDSSFYVDTTGAGAGQLAVRIKGPKGAFNVEMERDKQHDRLIVCRYEPQEQGDYSIEVKWAGEHVPGSPFLVVIFDTYQELDRYLAGVQVNPVPAFPHFPPGWVGQPPPGMFPVASMPSPPSLFPPPPPMAMSPPMARRMPPAVLYGSAPSSPFFPRAVN